MIFTALIGFLCSLGFATVDTQKLSSRVIELRKEVELINDQYKLEREAILNEMKVLSVQKAELVSNIRSEELRQEQLNEKVATLRKSIRESSVESAELEPVLTGAIEKLKSYINQSLPIKTQERQASLDKLTKSFEKNEISVVKATNQLWSLYEDEKRLARETSLHKQTIPIGEKLHLAEVVKVGMLFLYFRTDQGDVGLAERDGENWRYRVFTQPTQQEKVLTLVESLKRQIRQGYFEIPTRI